MIAPLQRYVSIHDGLVREITEIHTHEIKDRKRVARKHPSVSFFYPDSKFTPPETIRTTYLDGIESYVKDGLWVRE